MAKKNIGSDFKLERGYGGEAFTQSYDNLERRVDDLRLEDYRKMVDNDGQVQMLWNAITGTILSAGVRVDDDPDFTQDGDSEEKLFVEQNLLSPKWKGGLSKPLILTNATALRAYIDGYRLFEIVYRVEDNMIKLDKLAPRSAFNDAGIKLVIDDNGNFIGFEQEITFKNDKKKIKILNEGEYMKAIKVAYGEEFGSNYGRSGLRAVWYHYDKAHKGMYLNHVGHELGVVKPRIIKQKVMTTPDKLQNILNIFSRLHLDATVTYSDQEFEVEFAEVTDANVMQAGKEMINLHYSMMARSILAQFIDLGSATSSTGARALGDTQVKFFKQGLQAMAETLIENLWNPVIADLIKINFNRGIYPVLKVNEIDAEKAQSLMTVFMEMAKGNLISETTRVRLEELGAGVMGVEVSSDEIMADLEEKEAKQEAMLQNAQAVKVQPVEDKEDDTVQNSQPIHNHIHLEDMTKAVNEITPVENTAVRPLYENEKKTKFVDIKLFWDDSKRRMEEILRTKLSAQKEAIVQSYIEASRKGQKAVQKVQIQLEDEFAIPLNTQLLNATKDTITQLPQETYSEALNTLSKQIFEFGKSSASGELKKEVPNTPKQTNVAREVEVQDMLSKQESDLMFRLRTTANEGLANETPENEIRLALENEYDDFWNKALAPTVGMIISKNLNKGRKLVYDTYQGEIYAYRYSAILDARTTEYCRALDGRVFSKNDPYYALLTPPNHFGCRSIWTPILKSEASGVDIEGKPETLPTFSSVNTFRDTAELSDVEQKILSLFNEE